MNHEFASGYKDIFPCVMAGSSMAPRAVWVIASHAKDLGMAPLRPNHVRCFNQPCGYVGWAVDVDLDTGKVIRYPGTHSKTDASVGNTDLESFTRLENLLSSDAFRLMPSETPDAGCDGASVFIEVHMNGAYSWKCHWCPTDPTLLETEHVLSALWAEVFPRLKPTSVMAVEALHLIDAYAKSANMGMNIGPLKLDRARFFRQSLGCVESAIEVDLAAGRLIRYPPVSAKGSVQHGAVEPEKLAKLIALLKADAFIELAVESPNGVDAGSIYLIEAEIDGSYSWKCHWFPDNHVDKIIWEIKTIIEELSRDVETRHLNDEEARYRLLIKASPDWSNHWLLGWVLQRQGKLSDATAQYGEASRLEPKDGRPVAGIARVLLQQDKIPEAITCYQRSLRLTPNFPEAVYGLGRAYERAGLVAEADESFSRALAMDPHYIELHISDGNQLLRDGRPLRAIAYYGQTLRLRPHYSQVRFNLGRALEQVDHLDEAMGQYKQAMNLRPDFVRARNALARLREAQ